MKLSGEKRERKVRRLGKNERKGKKINDVHISHVGPKPQGDINTKTFSVFRRIRRRRRIRERNESRFFILP